MLGTPSYNGLKIGDYQMNEINFKLLEYWINSLGLETEKKPDLKDIHIDDLIGDHGNLVGSRRKRAMFFKAIELFNDLINSNLVKKFDENYIASLVYHLESSKKLRCDVRHIIWKDQDMAPPSIYLVPKIYFLEVKEAEDYKLPLNLKIFRILHNKCSVYYRCFRGLDDIKNNDEYSRGIYIHAWDKSVLSQSGWAIHLSSDSSVPSENC